MSSYQPPVMNQQPQPQQQPQMLQQQQMNQMAAPNAAPGRYGYYGPEAFRPLSPWAYFGWGIVYSIPIVGLVFLIIHSFSSTNINRRNYARSFFCALVLSMILFVICLAIFTSANALQWQFSVSNPGMNV